MVASSFVMRHAWMRTPDLLDEFDFWCERCGAHWIANAIVAVITTLLEATAVFTLVTRMVPPLRDSPSTLTHRRGAHRRCIQARAQRSLARALASAALRRSRWSVSMQTAQLRPQPRQRQLPAEVSAR